jgi:host factor-I protein
VHSRIVIPSAARNLLLPSTIDRRPSTLRVYNGAMAFRVPALSNPLKKAKTPPPEDTFEEAAYLKLLGEKQKPVQVKLLDGEVVRGWIEYYDKSMIRLTREGEPNLFIFKHEIMYIAEDGGPQKRVKAADGR